MCPEWGGPKILSQPHDDYPSPPARWVSCVWGRSATVASREPVTGSDALCMPCCSLLHSPAGHRAPEAEEVRPEDAVDMKNLLARHRRGAAHHDRDIGAAFLSV